VHNREQKQDAETSQSKEKQVPFHRTNIIALSTPAPGVTHLTQRCWEFYAYGFAARGSFQLFIIGFD
jgi:hypothetical protein